MLKSVINKHAIDKLVFLGLALLGLCLTNTDAVEMKDLYQAKIPVQDQSADTQWLAIVRGFKDVLVRKSGSKRVLSTTEVKREYAKVKSYLQRYEYSARQDVTSSFPFELLLDFEPRLIDSLIRSAGMPIWGSNRPVTLLWLAIEKDYQREIIKESSDAGSYSSMIELQAKRFGLPVIMPLMDFDDELNVSVSDVWGRFNQAVATASQRYAADSIVIGRVRQVGENWEASFSYINQSDEKRVTLAESSLVSLFGVLTSRLAELLCERYCVVELEQSHQVAIQVSNVSSYAHFKQVKKFLESLSSIRKVGVSKIASTVVRFDISLLGDLQSVKEGIELGKKMIKEAAFEPAAFRPLAESKTNPINPAENTNILLNKLEKPADDYFTRREEVEVNSVDGNSLSILYYQWVK